MEIYYLKKLRGRYTIEYKDDGQVWFADHRNREVIKYKNISKAVTNMIYELCGMSTGVKWEKRKRERKKRLEFYRWCRNMVYNGESLHFSGFKYI